MQLGFAELHTRFHRELETLAEHQRIAPHEETGFHAVPRPGEVVIHIFVLEIGEVGVESSAVALQRRRRSYNRPREWILAVERQVGPTRPSEVELVICPRDRKSTRLNS